MCLNYAWLRMCVISRLSLFARGTNFLHFVCLCLCFPMYVHVCLRGCIFLPDHMYVRLRMRCRCVYVRVNGFPSQFYPTFMESKTTFQLNIFFKIILTLHVELFYFYYHLLRNKLAFDFTELVRTYWSIDYCFTWLYIIFDN